MTPQLGEHPLSTPDTNYKDIYRRHRLLLTMPLVLGILISALTVLSAAKSYQSSASLWFDNAPPAPSSTTQTDPTIRPPAAQKQLILTELLGTRSFRINVGRNGPLAAYLASHPAKSSGPMSLLSKLKGSSGGTGVDDQIVSALSSKKVTTAVLGPQVLGINVQSVTPAVAAGTLKALLAEFTKEESTTSQAQAQAASSYYKDLVSSATQSAAAAQAKINTYLATHQVVATDPNLATLTQAATAAEAKLADANNNLDQATIDLSHLSASGTIQVLDPPNVPTSAAGGGKKKAILGVVAGLFAGGLLSLLGLLALAAADRKAKAAATGTSTEGEQDEPRLPVIGVATARARTNPGEAGRAQEPDEAPIAAISSSRQSGHRGEPVREAVGMGERPIDIGSGGPAFRVSRPRSRPLGNGRQSQDD